MEDRIIPPQAEQAAPAPAAPAPDAPAPAAPAPDEPAPAAPAPDAPDAPAPADMKKALKAFALIALALTVYIVLTSALQIGIALLNKELLLDVVLSSEAYMFLLVSLPQYAVALPAAYLIMRALPKSTATKDRLKAINLLAYAAVAFALMYIGNLIGTGLMATYDAILGVTSVNVAEALITQTSPLYNLITVAIFAPIFEELLFRRIIMDRILPYGELNACIFSALTFALFHGNFFQFFYAFGLGLLFAYIYAKTRNVLYTMLLHAIINLMGGVVSVAVINSGSVMLTMIYGYAVLLLLAAGVVMLVRHRKDVKFMPPELDLGKKRTKTVYFNAGMIAFYISCLALFAVNMGLLTV